MFSPYCMRSMALVKMMVKPIVEHFIKISVSGIEHIPRRGSFVLVSNHRSDLDPLVIGSVVPRYVAWIADSFLFNIPFISLILRQLGTIPISECRREQLRAFRRSREILQVGQPVGIFPEGHATIVQGSGLKVGKFYSGFAELAVANRAPVLPVTLIPVEEEFRPLNVPDIVRAWLHLPDDVATMQRRLVYRKVHVEISKPIETAVYSGGLCGKGLKGDVARLVSHTRVVIGDTFRSSGQ